MWQTKREWRKKDRVVEAQRQISRGVKILFLTKQARTCLADHQATVVDPSDIHSQGISFRTNFSLTNFIIEVDSEKSTLPECRRYRHAISTKCKNCCCLLSHWRSESASVLVVTSMVNLCKLGFFKTSWYFRKIDFQSERQEGSISWEMFGRFSSGKKYCVAHDI